MRLMFGGGSADFSIAAPSATLGILHSAPNLTGGTAWTAQTGGTRIMDLAKVSPTDPTPVAADPDGQTWTPVLTATTTNPTGYTATGTYTLDSSGTVVVTYAITFNADFSPGSGRYLLSVPVALAGSPVAVAYTMFAGSVRATVGANSKVYAPVYIDGGGLINLSDPNGALLNEAGPGVAWASGAMIRGVVIYPSIAA